jgi:hypothetical protein
MAAGVGRLLSALETKGSELGHDQAAKRRNPDRRQVLRSGLPPGGLRSRFAPPEVPGSVTVTR